MPENKLNILLLLNEIPLDIVSIIGLGVTMLRCRHLKGKMSTKTFVE